MKFSKRFVQAFCEVLDENDWLPDDWDVLFDEHICKSCGGVKSGEGDGGASTRAEVRRMLEDARERCSR